jgi:hypothetical protein
MHSALAEQFLCSAEEFGSVTGVQWLIMPFFFLGLIVPSPVETIESEL